MAQPWGSRGIPSKFQRKFAKGVVRADRSQVLGTGGGRSACRDGRYRTWRRACTAAALQAPTPSQICMHESGPGKHAYPVPSVTHLYGLARGPKYRLLYARIYPPPLFASSVLLIFTRAPTAVASAGLRTLEVHRTMLGHPYSTSHGVTVAHKAGTHWLMPNRWRCLS